jgi:NAD+ synthase
MKVERLLHICRIQAPPGLSRLKVTLRNFGRDRRYPIINRFRDPGTPCRARR